MSLKPLFRALRPIRDEEHRFQSDGQVPSERKRDPVCVVRLRRQASNWK